MQFLKKIIILSFCLGAIVACSHHDTAGKTELANWMEENGKIKVLSTVRMIDDLVGEIGQDRVDRCTLIHGEIDPHSYEMVKGDNEKIGFAHVVFYNGLGLEHGASLSYRLQKHPNAIAVAETIRNLQPEKILARGGQVDPHVWMDISLWKETIDPIVVALSALSPQDTEMFRANGNALKERMEAAHEEIVANLKDVPEVKRFLVTSHDSFHYFTRAYLALDTERQDESWNRRSIAPEGIAPEAQISPVDIQAVLDYLTLYRVDTIFSESNMSRDALRKIVEASEAKGWKVKIAEQQLHSDAMGAKDSESGTYLGMMRHNARVMKEAWRHQY